MIKSRGLSKQTPSLSFTREVNAPGAPQHRSGGVVCAALFQAWGT